MHKNQFWGSTLFVACLLVACGLVLNSCAGCDRFGAESKTKRIGPSVSTTAADFAEDPIIGTWISTAVVDMGDGRKRDTRLLYNFRKDGIVDVRWAVLRKKELIGEAGFPYKVDGVQMRIGAGKDGLVYPFGVSDDVLIMDGIKYVKIDIAYFGPKKDRL